METVERVEMRRLDPAKDELLIREAVSWIESAPRWFKDCDAVWGKENANDYLDQMRTDAQADFGLFDAGEFIAVLTVSLKGQGIYEAHLMAKPKSNPETIAIAISSLMRQLFENGMTQGWMWLAKKNRGVRAILESVGLRRDGLERIKGKSHGKSIEWCRYSTRMA